MNVHRYIRGLLFIGVAAGLVQPRADAADGSAVEAPALGSLRGVTLDPGGQPLALVSVAIHSMDGGVNRRVVSAGDGVFVADHLTPGPYLITAAAEGLASASAARVEVAENQTASHNVILAMAKAAPAAAPVAAPVATAADRAPLPIEEELAAMKERIAVLEAALKARAVPEPSPQMAAPLTARAAYPPAPAQAPGASPAGAPTAGSPPAPSAPALPVIPEALQAPDATPGVDNFTPFAYADFTWLNGTPRNHDTVLDTKFFTPEIRFDTHFMEDFNQPKDHTMGGATESFRSGEFQVEQISVGGDFHWQGVRGRILYMMGMFATTTPRNDGSAGVGQWDLRNAYKYVSEAWGGYHFNVNHGLNVDAGIFVSYIGLFSYYNFDNWTYQPSFVSSNTPWFFNGLRIQWFPTNKLKIEPWIVNGWQSYNKFNGS